jgi:SH3 domain-containing YSC84-like protein 1
MVKSIGRLISVLALFAVGLAGGVAEAKTDGQQRIVERARLALDSFLDDPNFNHMGVYVQNAYAVLIVPDLLKAGFFVGAEHGIGVLLVRNPQTGAWGKPAFYDLYGGSFGLQFGGVSSDVVFTVMNEGAVDKLLAHGIKLGADLGVAAGRMGAGVGAATTTHLGEDIYVFTKGKGLFGGFWLDGSWLRPKDDWNAAYYGRPVPAREIVRDHQVVASAEVSALHQSLTRF